MNQLGIFCDFLVRSNARHLMSTCSRGKMGQNVSREFRQMGTTASPDSPMVRPSTRSANHIRSGSELILFLERRGILS